MFKQNNYSDSKVYKCWINDDKRILSFNFVEGYNEIVFNTYQKFQEYCYQKTYWGYRVK